jgi:hypothetical protein
MDEMHASLASNRCLAENGPMRERAVETLTRIKYRLVTLLEDLLYTA